MRISADPKSERHWSTVFTQAPMVFLDGQVQPDAIEADDELGTVRRCARDATGRLIVDGDDIRIEELSGAVEFRGERRAR